MPPPHSPTITWQVCVRDCVPSALACLLIEPPETQIAMTFLLKTLYLQGCELNHNFALGEGVMPACFKTPEDGRKASESHYGGIATVAPIDAGFRQITLRRSNTMETRDFSQLDMLEMQRGTKFILNLCLSDGFDTLPTPFCADKCRMIDRRREAGIEVDPYGTLNAKAEGELELVREKLFYSVPCRDDPLQGNPFDAFMPGLSISAGGPSVSGGGRRGGREPEPEPSPNPQPNRYLFVHLSEALPNGRRALEGTLDFRRSEIHSASDILECVTDYFSVVRPDVSRVRYWVCCYPDIGARREDLTTLPTEVLRSMKWIVACI